MKRNWSFYGAVSYLQYSGVEVDDFKKVILGKGLNGLKACSALDYLRKYHKFTVFLYGKGI